DRGRYGRTTRSRLRVRDVGIGSGVDVVRVGGTKFGNVDGRRLILGQGEVRCIGRLGVEAARLQRLDLSLVGTGAVAEKPSLTRCSQWGDGGDGRPLSYGSGRCRRSFPRGRALGGLSFYGALQ